MSQVPRYEPVISPEWFAAFLDVADLDASFEGLAACRHFHAETMRGRIRSLQLRLDEAEAHFRRADELSLSAPRDVPNTIRVVVLQAYWLETKLLAGGGDDLEGVPELQFPEFPPELVKEYPEIRLIENLRLSAEGLLRLYMGHFEVAARSWRTLIEKLEAEGGSKQAGAYLGLAACLHNLGRHAEARRQLENAGLAVQVGGRTLERVRAAANLQAAYTCLGLPEEAEGWAAFLRRIQCPEATKEIMFRRCDLVVARWASEAKLVLA